VSNLGDEDVAIEIEGQQAGAAIGRVTAAGARAQHLVGKRVLAGPVDPCGECDVCRRGGAGVCPTARHRSAPLTSPVIATARYVVPLGEPDGIDLPSPLGAAAAGDLAVAYTLYARSGLGPREPVVVVGEGSVATFLVGVLQAKGLEPVVYAGDLAAVRAVFATRGIATKPWRVIAASPTAILEAAALCGPRSTLTVLARDATQGIPAETLAREVTVIPVAAAHPDLIVEAAALVMKGAITLIA